MSNPQNLDSASKTRLILKLESLDLVHCPYDLPSLLDLAVIYYNADCLHCKLEASDLMRVVAYYCERCKKCLS